MENTTTINVHTPEIRSVPADRDTAISVPGNTGIKVVRACTIRRDAGELYAFWRKLENLPRIIKHPVTIQPLTAEKSHWAVSSPASDDRTEWDAVIINDQPGELIAWRSCEGAQVENAGSVRFERAPGDEGTEVTVSLEYNAPAGQLGALVAKLTGEEPGQQVADALRRFKALMEAGEIPTTRGQPVGGSQRRRRKKQ